MKITFVKYLEIIGNSINTDERTFHFDTLNWETIYLPVGQKAESIKLEIEFGKDDIPTLIKFLQNSEPCFRS